MENQQSAQPVDTEEIEGLGEQGSWGDYPLDEMLIRNDHRTVHDVLWRIKQGRYVMDPDFQRDFIWAEDKQSKLIESVIMRIPLPVFYMAEDNEGRTIIVDGLQRLSTFQRFVENKLRLRLPDRKELHDKQFSELPPKFQNRIEDCNLIFYIIDSKAPERARLDIFERVNGGVPLTRQQMRNCLFMGPATRFLKEEAQTRVFLEATDSSLNRKTMRDREFINRFCAFRLLRLDEYRGDMDDFLAKCLSRMNNMEESDLRKLSMEFRRGLDNNFYLFGRHAFRKSIVGEFYRRSMINASLWDVMSTGLSFYAESEVQARAESLRDAVRQLLKNGEFERAITLATGGTKQVKYRFRMAQERFQEVLGAHAD